MTGTDTAAGRATAEPRGPRELEGVAGPVRSVMAGNLVLRFLVELATYAALGYWGASVPAPWAVRVALAVATPAAAVAVWTQLLAPRATHRLREPGALVSEVVICVGAAVALAVSASPTLGAVLGATAIANAVVVRVFARRQGRRSQREERR